MSENTVRAYARDVQNFLNEVHGTFTVDEFSDLAADWIAKGRRRVAPSTLARRRSSLVSFARWASIEHNLNDIRLPKDLRSKPTPVRGGLGAVQRMINAANTEEHGLIVALGGMAGLRISETRKVRSSSIDPIERLLTVDGKGAKRRVVPISPMLWNALEIGYYRSLINQDALLVRLSDRCARSAVSTLARRAGVPGQVSSHDLRATFATQVYRKTLNLRVVQELLGHSSVAVTQVYLGVEDVELREAVNL